jgi:GTP pyrophosphokinase
VTLDYTLSTGDQVDIIVSQGSKGPGKDWLNIVKTSQARSKIRQWFKSQNRPENVLRGQELLEAEAKKTNVALSDLLAEGREGMIVERFNCIDFESLCATVGSGGIRETQVISRLYREYDRAHPSTDIDDIIRIIEEDAVKLLGYKKKSGIYVNGIGDVNVRFSKCCGPLPGDAIIGFITRGRGMSIHRSDCINITSMDVQNQKRLMHAEWKLPERTSEGSFYHADLRIVCDDRDGLLIDIHKFFIDEKVKVSSLNARVDKADAIFDIGIEIDNSEHLNRLCSKLNQKRDVQNIRRVSL